MNCRQKTQLTCAALTITIGEVAEPQKGNFMEEIIIQLKGKAKARMLSEFLTALDFVSSVTLRGGKKSKTAAKQPKAAGDFSALAGLWGDRDVTLESIRKQAWPRQTR